MTSPLLDHDRVGGIGWLERTGGSLTDEERRRLRRHILLGQLAGVTGRLAVLLGRRPDSTEAPTPPDSAMARAAEVAAADQPPTLVEHSYRTWLFGRALASFDGVSDLDDELFYVASLLHDAGLVSAVTGEDFTLRSVAAAAEVAAPHCGHGDVLVLRDAVAAHSTPGVSIETDGAVAFFVQAGATCDLGGLRLQHLAKSFVADTLERHPRRGLVDDIRGRIDVEADAVPDGRFALLRRTGFGLAIRLAPLPG